MFLEYTPEQQALRKELREYFAQLLTPEVRAELGEPGEGSPRFRDVVRQIGTDGWLGIGWPQEYGGQGRPATDQFIFFDEVQRAGAPFPFVTLNTVGPTIMRFGSDEQKSFFLPGILAGEINFAICYTEPEACTDLASLRTRAALDGDDITAVSSPKRTIPTKLRRALEARYPTCAVSTCANDQFLEIDHVVPLEEHGRTELENLWRLCSHHHRLKTYEGWKVVGRNGTRDLVPPDDPDPPVPPSLLAGVDDASSFGEPDRRSHAVGCVPVQ